MEPEALRQQFPYYNELQAIYAARMQRILWMEAEEGGSSSKKKSIAHQLSSDDEEEENEDSGHDQEEKGRSKKKRKIIKGNTSTTNINASSGNVNLVSGLKEVLDDFMKQQMGLEMQWLKAYEKREEERRMKEMEWRQTMIALENERLMVENSWREREEQRKVREEARAEKRDALIIALLNKLRRED